MHGMYPEILAIAQNKSKAVPEVPDESGDLPPNAKQQIRLRSTVTDLMRRDIRVFLRAALRLSKPLDEYMNDAFKLDKQLFNLQFSLDAASSSKGWDQGLKTKEMQKVK